ncbi:hypothetical protein DOTSEDRAFT_137288 [Dothistroma septosporum NZE10]|uniref:Uncharacterized protein n=1 Tax=Dothistroma septosporum (strain NZE10 / CBS 128990) TaxID=675120 RepID=N1PE74_DOTSN|nr:hypothetical protein DOTSEDRAFT_137288 [Dothistroma septosporum NZE10]
MSQPSRPTFNALIYCSYTALHDISVLGLAITYRLREQSKTEPLSANGTRKGKAVRPIQTFGPFE